MMHEREFENVRNLPPEKRYEYFIKRVAAFEEVWGLYENGWAMTGLEGGGTALPLWPAKEFATAYAKGEWSSYSASPISLEELINEWIPRMIDEDFRPSVFLADDDIGVVVSPEKFREHLEEELEKY